MIKALNNTHSQARVSGGEMDLLASLGEQLQLDPEMAKLLTAEGELPADFKAALADMSFEDAQNLVDTLNQQTAQAGAKQAELNQKVQSVLPENVARLGEARPTPVESDLKTLLSQPGQKSQAPEQLMVKQRNAEDASRAFMPERKSIFAVQKQNSAGAQKAQQSNSQVQNTQGLVDLNQFMANQSPNGKDRALRAQYKNEQQSLFANKAFAEKQMPNINPIQAMGAEGEEASLGDMGRGQEHLLAQKLEAANAQATGQANKVFDMNSLVKTSDMDAVINQIQDYVMQAKAAKEPTAQMTFNHPELGDVDVLVKKGAGKEVHVTIGHQGQEAAKFFKQHQGELLQTLQQSGVQVGEFKLESSSSSNQNNQNNQNSFDQNGKQQFANEQRSNQEQQRREDSQKREELWNLLNDENANALDQERKSA